MSEDEETVCHLTYKEGKEIEKEARRPYEKEALIFFYMGLFFLVFTLVFTWVLQTFDIGNHPDLDMLLANGDITQGFYDYEIERIRGQIPMMGCYTMVVLALVGLALETIGKIEGRKALKEANEKKDERWTRE